MGFQYETESKVFEQDVLDASKAFQNILEGVATEEDQRTFFDDYFDMPYAKQAELKRMYGSLLTNILELGRGTINDFIKNGYDVQQMAALAGSIESAMEGLTKDGDNKADDIAKFYTETLAGLDLEETLDPANEALSETIREIRELGLTSEEEDKYVRQLVNTLTDPMAFNSGMNAVREATNSIKALMDASEEMANGELPNNIEQLLQAYPALASQLMDGSLTIEEAYDAVAATRIQAQIDLLERYASNPALLMNKEDMVEDGVKEMEDRYKSEISFIKSLNDAKKQEIDLMKQKIDMNKSMLEIDRQIAALAKDTSYGAQAKLQDLRDEQRSEAIQREKFVMDLITEQAISELEEESRRAVLKISDNVEKLLAKLNEGSGDGSFGANTAESPI
jgi:hypothetical protein